MDYPSPGNIIDILRNTLRRLEQAEDFRQEDHAVIELKRHIIQSIAELEVMKSAHCDAEAENEDAMAAPSRRSRTGNEVPSKTASRC